MTFLKVGFLKMCCCTIKNSPSLWCYLPKQVFESRFTSEDLRSGKESTLVYFDHLEALSSEAPSRLKGFIFHTGRTGSTLSVNLLRSTNATHVISESRAVSDLFRYGYLMTENQLSQALNIIMKLFEIALAKIPKDIVFKWSSWHIFHQQLIRKTFSDIPGLMIWRNPVEVISALLGFGSSLAEQE